MCMKERIGRGAAATILLSMVELHVVYVQRDESACYAESNRTRVC